MGIIQLQRCAIVRAAYLAVFVGGMAVAVATGAQAQPYAFEVDSIQAFLDRDKDCSDFSGLVDAQAHYEALQIVVGDSTADPHRLDADGNQYACESLRYNRLIVFSEDWWVRTVETLHSAYCGPITGVIEVQEFSDRMARAPFEQQQYLPTINEVECLDTLYELYNNQ
jgi:hypothetical protein